MNMSVNAADLASALPGTPTTLKETARVGPARPAMDALIEVLKLSPSPTDAAVKLAMDVNTAAEAGFMFGELQTAPGLSDPDYLSVRTAYVAARSTFETACLFDDAESYGFEQTVEGTTYHQQLDEANDRATADLLHFPVSDHASLADKSALLECDDCCDADRIVSAVGADLRRLTASALSNRRDGDVATEAGMADIFDRTEMPIWSMGDIFLPSNVDWAKLADPHLVTLRIAALTVGKSKSELMELVESLSQDEGEGEGRSALMDIVDHMMATEQMLSSWEVLVKTAETRLMTALAKMLQAEEDDASDEPE